MNTDLYKKTIFPVVSGNEGDLKRVIFIDGSYKYESSIIKQTFEYILLDNVGSGDVRFSFKQVINMENPIAGAKTLKRGDSLALSYTVELVSIYFLQASVVEMILISR